MSKADEMRVNRAKKPKKEGARAASRRQKETPRPNRLREMAAELFGIPLQRTLDLARPMQIDVGRIGYPDEGLRLTLSLGSPYEFNAEVKLSRADTAWLMMRLQQALDDPRNENLK